VCLKNGYLSNRIKQSKIIEPSCLKRQIIACSDLNGNYKLIEQQFVGKIKIPGAGHYIPGAPLSSYFFLEQCQRFEIDLTKHDKNTLFGELKMKLFDILLQSNYFCN